MTRHTNKEINGKKAGHSMRNELSFIDIDHKYYGGDQNWSRRWIVRVGGCSTVTACEIAISLARRYGSMRALYPYDAATVTSPDFMSFADSMLPFVGPGAMGLTDIEKYASGLRAYAESRDVALQTQTLSGDSTASEALAFVKRSIDAGHPAAYLMLKHWDKTYDELEWHWFTITGYDWTGDRPKLIGATYGQRFAMDLGRAWDTRRNWRGGLVTAEPAAN